MAEGQFEQHHPESHLSAEEMINQMAANTPEDIKETERDAVMHEFMAELDIVPRKLALEARKTALETVAKHHELGAEQLEDALRDLEKLHDAIAAEFSDLARTPREIQQLNRKVVETQFGKPERE